MAIERQSEGAAASEWRAGWPLVLTGLVGNLLCGFGAQGMGAFIAPMEQSLGWSRAAITSGISIYAFLSMFCLPVVGAVLDRWGARHLVLPGTIITAAAIMLFGTVGSSLVYWLLLWVLLAIGNQLIALTIWSAAVSRAFTVSRGLALGIVTSGSGLCAIIAPLTANAVIERSGWRTAFFDIGLAGGLLLALAIIFLFREPRSPATAHNSKAATAMTGSGLTVGQALRSAAFWKLAATALLAYALGIAMLVHLIPILSISGLSRDTAVWVAGSLGLFMTIGMVGVGLVADRVAPRLTIALCVGLVAIPGAMLLYPSSSIAARLLAVMLFGLPYGAFLPALAYVATRYLGMRHFGALFGFLVSMVALGTATGPLIAGLLYDRTGNYALLLGAAIPVSLICALLMLSLGRVPDFAEADAKPYGD